LFFFFLFLPAKRIKVDNIEFPQQLDLNAIVEVTIGNRVVKYVIGDLIDDDDVAQWSTNDDGAKQLYLKKSIRDKLAEDRLEEHGEIKHLLVSATNFAFSHAEFADRSASVGKYADSVFPDLWANAKADIDAAAAVCGVTLKSDAELTKPFDDMWVGLEKKVIELANTANPDEVLHVHPVAELFLDGLHSCHDVGDVQLYVEKTDVLSEGVQRRPDACFYRVGLRFQDGFDLGAQREAVLACEWKNFLRVSDDGEILWNDNGRAAFEGCIRDAEDAFGSAMPVNEARLPFFFCLIGDGVRYALVRVGKPANSKIRVIATPAIQFADEAGRSDKLAVRAFFNLCGRALQVAASRKWLVGGRRWAPEQAWPANVQVTNVVAGGATIVFRFLDSSGRAMIAKSASLDDGVLRLKNEIAKRRLVADRAAAQVPPIAPVASIFLAGQEVTLCGFDALLFDDTGLVSFESLVYQLPDDETRALTKRVWAQVGASLALLHRLGFAFADVHPGNILISRDLENAFLTDCESICQIGTLLDKHVLIRLQFRPLSTTASAETDFESLRYCVAWALDLSQFRTCNVSRQMHNGVTAVPAWDAIKRTITPSAIQNEMS
jgi:hypothetical protein